jgi:hypothetical protein
MTGTKAKIVGLVVDSVYYHKAETCHIVTRVINLLQERVNSEKQTLVCVRRGLALNNTGKL